MTIERDPLEPSNDERAARIDSVLEAYFATRGDGPDIDETDAVDLLCDLMHWLERQQVPIHAVLQYAAMNYEAESGKTADPVRDAAWLCALDVHNAYAVADVDNGGTGKVSWDQVDSASVYARRAMIEAGTFEEVKEQARAANGYIEPGQPRPFTVVGYWHDNQQPIVEHVMALSASDAPNGALRAIAEREGTPDEPGDPIDYLDRIAIVEVLEGHTRGCLGNEEVCSAHAAWEKNNGDR